MVRLTLTLDALISLGVVGMVRSIHFTGSPCVSNILHLTTGTLLSGFLYTYVGGTIVTGFGACFVASLVFVLLSCVLAFPIRDDIGGLACGPCLQLFGPPPSSVITATV